MDYPGEPGTHYSVIAGGLGASLPALPAVGSILHRDNYKGKRTDVLTSPLRAAIHRLSDSKWGINEIELLEVPPAVFVAPVVRQGICRVIQSGHLRASHFAFSNSPLDPELSAFQVFHLTATLSVDYSICGGAVRQDLSFGIFSTLFHHVHQAQDLRHALYDRIQFSLRRTQSHHLLGA